MIRNCLPILLFVASNGLYAQELIPIGTWRSHFNYEETSLVEKTTNNIFAATSHGLLYYDPEDQSINKLSKVDGLNDVGITAMAFDENQQYLVLGYQSGNIDLISNEGIVNLPVLLNSDITENKQINHIGFGDEVIHLSTDFGLLVLNTENQVEEAFLNLGESGHTIIINASVVANNYLYLATEQGVLAGELDGGINLQDFNNWERFSGSSVDAQDLNSIVTADGNIYTSSATSIFKWRNNAWINMLLTLEADEEILKLRSGINMPIVLTNQRVLLIAPEDTFTTVSLPNDASVLDIYQEDDNAFWYADQQKGLTLLEEGASQHVVLDGPSTNLASLKIMDGDIYAFPELSTNYAASVSNGLGYSLFNEGEWQIIGPGNLSGFSNITDVLVVNDQTLLSSFGDGIINLSNGEVTDRTNSPLDENGSGTGNTLVSGLLQDNDQNIWVTNFSTYSLMKWDGTNNWETFEFGSSAATEPVKSGIYQNNQIWMTLGLLNGRGLLGYDIATNSHRYVTSNTTNLPSDRVYDLAFGLEDEIWIATDNGLAYFPFSFGIIEDQSIDVSFPVFEENILFENKAVYALAVDGGNRLWVGTDDGLYLFSENIQELVYHFEEDNSPLPSNTILDLEIHPETGELFVLTDQGLVSFRTDATAGTNRHQLVEIYPNPVLPDFEGWVGFSGLVENAQLKITNISGQLVREISANGGGAMWDVKDYSGRRVNSGVYLVFSASSDGSETFVGKIAVIK